MKIQCPYCGEEFTWSNKESKDFCPNCHCDLSDHPSIKSSRAAKALRLKKQHERETQEKEQYRLMCEQEERERQEQQQKREEERKKDQLKRATSYAAKKHEMNEVRETNADDWDWWAPCGCCPCWCWCCVSIILLIALPFVYQPTDPNIPPTTIPPTTTIPIVPINGIIQFENNTDNNYQINVSRGWIQIQLQYDYDPNNGKVWSGSFGDHREIDAMNNSRWYNRSHGGGVITISIKSISILKPNYVLVVKHVQDWNEPDSFENPMDLTFKYERFPMENLFVAKNDVDWFNFTGSTGYSLYGDGIYFDVYDTNKTVLKTFQIGAIPIGNYVIRIAAFLDPPPPEIQVLNGSNHWYDLWN